MEKTAAIAVLAINNYIDNALDHSETADVYKTLREDFGMTDESIASLGYAWLIPEESNETDELLKEYTFLYTESMSGTFTVKAHNEDEAWERVESIEFSSADLNFNDDGEFTLIDTH